MHDPVHPVCAVGSIDRCTQNMCVHAHHADAVVYRLNLRKYGNIMTSKNYSCSKHVIFVLNYDETEFLNGGNF